MRRAYLTCLTKKIFTLFSRQLPQVTNPRSKQIEWRWSCGRTMHSSNQFSQPKLPFHIRLGLQNCSVNPTIQSLITIKKMLPVFSDRYRSSWQSACWWVQRWSPTCRIRRLFYKRKVSIRAELSPSASRPVALDQTARRRAIGMYPTVLPRL